jgi:hypothetical protein
MFEEIGGHRIAFQTRDYLCEGSSPNGQDPESRSRAHCAGSERGLVRAANRARSGGAGRAEFDVAGRRDVNIFARGAVEAALRLHGKAKGFYGMDDVLGV